MAKKTISSDDLPVSTMSRYEAKLLITEAVYKGGRQVVFLLFLLSFALGLLMAVLRT